MKMTTIALIAAALAVTVYAQNAADVNPEEGFDFVDLPLEAPAIPPTPSSRATATAKQNMLEVQSTIDAIAAQYAKDASKKRRKRSKGKFKGGKGAKEEEEKKEIEEKEEEKKEEKKEDKKEEIEAKGKAMAAEVMRHAEEKAAQIADKAAALHKHLANKANKATKDAKEITDTAVAKASATKKQGAAVVKQMRDAVEAKVKEVLTNTKKSADETIEKANGEASAKMKEAEDAEKQKDENDSAAKQAEAQQIEAGGVEAEAAQQIAKIKADEVESVHKIDDEFQDSQSEINELDDDEQVAQADDDDKTENVSDDADDKALQEQLFQVVEKKKALLKHAAVQHRSALERYLQYVGKK